MVHWSNKAVVDGLIKTLAGQIVAYFSAQFAHGVFCRRIHADDRLGGGYVVKTY